MNPTRWLKPIFVFIHRIKITETEKQTGLKQDARGTWVRPETLPPDENDWRSSLL
jgi:hypothetical protein